MINIDIILKEAEKMGFAIENVDNSKDAGFYDKNGIEIDGKTLFNSFNDTPESYNKYNGIITDYSKNYISNCFFILIMLMKYLLKILKLTS